MDEGTEAGGAQRDLSIPGLEGAVEVGRGGFAVVYRCRQPAFGRTVAVKVMRDTVGDNRTRTRFKRECLAMGVLSGHPYIVTVYDAGFLDSGDPYMVMDFMSEGSLADAVAARGPMTWQEVLRDGVMLAGALESAHRAGVLHRDIKPENVMRSRYGAVKLTDFGIARLRDGPQTRTEGLTASIPHVAPELLEGQQASVRSDLYALGSTMYQLLSGEAAFVRPTDESLLAALTRIAAEPVPDLRPAGVPDPLCEIIEQLMAKDPEQRPPSAADLGRTLQQLQTSLGQPVTELALLDAATELPPAPVESPATPPAPAAPAASTQQPPVAEAPTAMVQPLASAAPPAPQQPAPPPPPDAAPPAAPPPGDWGAAAVRRRRPALLGMAVLLVVAVVAGVAVLATRQPVVAGDPSGGQGTSEEPGGATESGGDGSRPTTSAELLQPVSVSASATASPIEDPVTGPAVQGVRFERFDAAKAVDGAPVTAWSAPGSAVGETITLDFGETVRITAIGLLPGHARVDVIDNERPDRFFTTRRVVRARYGVDDGPAVDAVFAERPAVQFVAVAVVTTTLTVEILETTGSAVRDFTAISEIEVFGATTADPVGGGSAEGEPPMVEAEVLLDPPPEPPGDRLYVFPVQPARRASYLRDHRRYPATDLYAPCGTAVVAPTAGRLRDVQRTDRWDPDTNNDERTRGGIHLTLMGDDSVRYYISHFGELDNGIESGERVTPGTYLGTVGRTGTAHDEPCHLHFGISPVLRPRDLELRRGVVFPWPYLDDWKAGGERSPRAEVRAWAAENL